MHLFMGLSDLKSAESQLEDGASGSAQLSLKWLPQLCTERGRENVPVGHYTPPLVTSICAASGQAHWGSSARAQQPTEAVHHLLVGFHIEVHIKPMFMLFFFCYTEVISKDNLKSLIEFWPKTQGHTVHIKNHANTFQTLHVEVY